MDDKGPAELCAAACTAESTGMASPHKWTLFNQIAQGTPETPEKGSSDVLENKNEICSHNRLIIVID